MLPIQAPFWMFLCSMIAHQSWKPINLDILRVSAVSAAGVSQCLSHQCGGSVRLSQLQDAELWKWDWCWWFGTWILFSPIVGMMIQSDELIFFRGVGIPPIRWWESLQTNVRFLQIQQQKNAGIIHSSACYTPSHRSWSDPFPVNQGVLKHNMNGFLKGN